MKKMWLILILFLLTGTLFGGKAAVLPELLNPKNIVVGEKRIFISDYPSIYIYSLSDYSLLKKFGRRGHGPAEFFIDREDLEDKARGLLIYLQDRHIVVNSRGRVSFFTTGGDYVKMIKKNQYGGGSRFYPMGKNFIGRSGEREGQAIFETVCLFGPDLEKVKEIYRCEHFLRSLDYVKKGLNYNFFERARGTVLYEVYDNTIFISRGGADTFLIEAFDDGGNKRYDIRRETETIKIPGDFKDRVHSYYRLKFKRGIKWNLEHTAFPQYYPPIRSFKIADGKIYVLTHKREGDKNQMIVLDLKGNYVKTVFLPVKEKNPEFLYPYYIHKGKFYQLIENEEAEEWELFVSVI